MQVDIDLKRILRRVYMSYFQDGLWDICLGLFLLGWGVSILTGYIYLMGGGFMVIYFAVWGLKKGITYQRIGYVRMDERETRMKARFTLILGIMVLAGALMLVIGLPAIRPDWLSDYFPLLFSCMIALVVGGVGWWMGAYRFILHAVIIFLAGAANAWLGVEWPHTYIAAGGIITLIGLIKFILFLSKYPKISSEERDVAG